MKEGLEKANKLEEEFEIRGRLLDTFETFVQTLKVA